MRILISIACFLAFFLSTSCVGYRLNLNDKGGIMDKKEALGMRVKKGKSGGNNMINSINITLDYTIYKNKIPYTFNPEDFVVDVIYPRDCVPVNPVTEKSTGLLRYLRTEPFTLEGKKSAEVRFKIESVEPFNLDSLNVRLLSPGFVTQNGEHVLPDTIVITAKKWFYR